MPVCRWLRRAHVPERWLPREWRLDACEQEVRRSREHYWRALERLFASYAFAVFRARESDAQDVGTDGEASDDGGCGLVGRLVRKLLASDRSALDADCREQICAPSDTLRILVLLSTPNCESYYDINYSSYYSFITSFKNC